MDRAAALEAITEHADQFRDDFPAWIEANWPIWTRFEQMALETSRRRDHYSARTLWHVIRHHTMLKEQGGQWKLNDHFSVDCARLFHLLHPALANFFETRRRTAQLLEGNDD